MADSLGGLLDPQALELLRQYMAQLAPSDEDKKAAKMQAITNFGLGLLGGRKGNELPTIGASGLNAMNQYQRDLTLGQAQRGQNINQAMSLMQMQKAQQAAQAQAALQQQVGSIFSGGPQPQNMGPGGPTPQNAAAAAPPSQIEQYRKAAALYAASGNTEGAKRMADIANSMEAEYSTSPQTFMREGKPVTALVGKRGEVKPLEGYGPKPDYKEVGTGQEKFFYDPMTGTRAGGFQMQATPGEQLSANVSMRGQNMTDARSREQNAIALTGKQIEQVHMIRKEANALPDVQNYRASVPMINSAAKAPNTRAGDLDVIYAVGKALDPNSVVREGELNLVIKSGTLPQQIQGMTSYVMGGGKLAPQQRAELMGMLANRVDQLKQAHDAALQPYLTQAQAAGLPADQLFIKPPEVQNKPAAASGNLTPAEAAELAALKKKHGR